MKQTWGNTSSFTAQYTFIIKKCFSCNGTHRLYHRLYNGLRTYCLPFQWFDDFHTLLWSMLSAYPLQNIEDFCVTYLVSVLNLELEIATKQGSSPSEIMWLSRNVSMYFLFPTLVPELFQQCPSHSRRHLTASLFALQCFTNMSVPLSEWWKQKQT